MILYNYTSLKNRDTKIYNVGGYSLASGISINFLTVVGPAAIIAIILGCIVAIPFGISFFNPFSDTFYWQYTFAWIAVGVGIGCALWFIQFAGYRLYQYLAAYFKPKAVYMNDFKRSTFKLTNFQIRTFVKKLL